MNEVTVKPMGHSRRREHPARDVALTYLHHYVQECRSRAIERLPTVSHLASMAGVARGTMWKAVRELTSRGELIAKPRAGIALAPSKPAGAEPTGAPADRPHGRPWERAADSLRAAILSGRYRPDDLLPPSKSLCAEFGICQRTLRRCLQHLTQLRVVEPFRKRYRIPPVRGAHAANRVFVIGRNVRLPEVNMAASVLQLVETECARAGLHFQPVLYGYTSGRWTFDPIDRPQRLVFDRRELADTLGFVLLCAGIADLNPAEAIAHLSGYGRPVAVFDQEGVTCTPRSGRGKRIAHFTRGLGLKPGLEMGRYLARLGHRRVAYFSTSHHAAWSRSRLQGLREGFREMGLSNAVAAFTFEQPIDLHASWNEATAFGAALDEIAQSRMSESAAALAHVMSTEAKLPVIRAVQSTLAQTRVAAQLNESFNHALSDPSLTAWVAADDSVGCHCLAALRQRGVRVPQQVSVVGFDDSLAAVTARMTSYHFDIDGAVRAMVAHIVDSTWLARHGGGCGAPMPVSGFVNVRDSSGPCMSESCRP